MTPESNLDFTHDSGSSGEFLFPEMATGGVALFDYDGDGDLDLYFVQGGAIHPANSDAAMNRLFRNLGDWQFEDVTLAAGVGDRGYGMGCTCGDFDRDGDQDLYVTNLESNVLYRNNGDGTFDDVTSTAGVGDDAWSTCAALADIDGDADLDLFVTNYIGWTRAGERTCENLGHRDYCSPVNYGAPAMDTLYLNQGDGSFVDITRESGVNQSFGNGFGVVTADFNQDGRLDFYVANDGTANQLWMNQGDGRFTDESLIAGCAYNHEGWSEAGMGLTAVDVEADGDVDLFVTHLYEESNTLYVNDAGVFNDRTAQFGLDAPSRGHTGFGVGFADFDHDGCQDLYVANGAVKRQSAADTDADPYSEGNQLYRGLPDGTLAEVDPPGGTADHFVATSRAAAFGDIDNDGDIDIVVVNRDGSPHLLRNIVGQEREWIMLRVLDAQRNDAIGAVVTLESAEGPRVRIVQQAYSYCAGNDVRVHFGLDESREDCSIVVNWLSGRSERFEPLTPGTCHNIIEGRGEPTTDTDD